MTRHTRHCNIRKAGLNSDTVPVKCPQTAVMVFSLVLTAAAVFSLSTGCGPEGPDDTQQTRPGTVSPTLTASVTVQDGGPSLLVNPMPIPTPFSLPLPTMTASRQEPLVILPTSRGQSGPVSTSAHKPDVPAIPLPGDSPTIIPFVTAAGSLVAPKAPSLVHQIEPEATSTGDGIVIQYPEPRNFVASALVLAAPVFDPTPSPVAPGNNTQMPGPSPLPPSTVEVVPARAVTPIPTPLATATAAPTATPTPAPPATPQPPGTAQGDVIIECIFFDGEVPRSEADEYVQLTNQGSVAADLRGWTLVDLDDRGQMFTFGESYSIAPGGSVRIYTNQVHPEWGGFSFDYGRSIWNNSNPDTAGLFDPSGNQVSRKSYPPGC